MTKWSLPSLFADLHGRIQSELESARRTIGHSGSKGDATEGVWLNVMKEYLPKRYKAAKGHVVDSRGNFSEQVDIVVFDRQYTPFIFHFQGQTVIAAESVYAVLKPNRR